MSKAAELAALIGSQTALSNRNLIINGAMQVAQRGSSFTGVTTPQFSVDRFKYFLNNSGTFTVEQSTDAPTGFSNSTKLSCTVADSSLGASDYDILQQRIEGQNLQHLQFGTSGAKKLTLSFWVKSNLTGNFVVDMQVIDNSPNAYKSIQYSINSANTWEYKTLTFTGTTTNAIANDNTNGLEISFWLAAGSDYNSGTHTDDVFHGDNTKRAAGLDQNLSGSTSNTWQVTGIQLEVGETATPFEHRSFGDELARCQRYFYVYGGESGAPNVQGYGKAGDNTFGFTYPCGYMRASPSGATSGTWQKSNCGDPVLVHQSSRQFSVRISVTSEGAYEFYPSSGSGKIELSAEL